MSNSNSLAERIYALLLCAYSPVFRDRFAIGMRYVFLQQLAEVRTRGPAATASFWVRSAFGAVAFGLRSRLSDRSARRASRQRGESMRDLLSEVRYALRRLVRAPAFTVAAMLTLALGLGASTAIYSVVQGVLLDPLPYDDAERLVTVWHSAPGGEIARMDVSTGTWAHYRDRSSSLASFALFRGERLALTGYGPPQQVTAAGVSGEFFATMRGRPAVLGRLIGVDDDRPGAAKVAVISHRLWRQRYGGADDIVGRTLRLDGDEVPVIGVAPPSFEYPWRETDVWFPLGLGPDAIRLGAFSFGGIARLAPDVSLDAARADLRGLVPGLFDVFPGAAVETIVGRGRLTPHLTPLREHLFGNVERTLWILLGTVGIVLLIACANVANLFLVRADGRQREMALRAALGAGRRSLLGHFLAESLVLGLLAGGVGLMLAQVAVRALVRFGPSSLPRLHEVAIDARVMLFALGVSIAAGVLLGAVPVLRGGAIPSVALKDGGHGMTPGRDRFRFGHVLAAAEVALALILLAGAGLLMRSFMHLKTVDPGFDAHDALTFRLSLSPGEHPELLTTARFHQQLIESLAAVPGVEAVGAVDCPPLHLGQCGNVNPLLREGHTAEEDPQVAVEQRVVSPGYFRAMGIPLIAGRELEPADLEQRKAPAVVSRSLAARFWPGESPLGRRIFHNLSSEPAWYTIVGVVEDVRQKSLVTPSEDVAYFPLIGRDDRTPEAPYSLQYVVRMRPGAPADVGALRAAVWDLDPNLPLADVRALESVVADAEAPMTFALLLLGVSAAVALILGLVGVYGVLSYMVSRRRNEIGVRVALGARAEDISRLVLGRGLMVAGVGGVGGALGALALTRVMSSLLYNVQPGDPATLLAASAGMVFLALGACWLPARRAARQDPIEALRAE